MIGTRQPSHYLARGLANAGQLDNPPQTDPAAQQPVIKLEVDLASLNKVATTISRVKDNFEKNASKAMTYAAYDAQKELRRQTPRFIDNPTPWTQKSTFVERATPQSMAVRLGFKDAAVKGTPAAQYIQAPVAGGIRRVKPFERQLRSTGVLRSNEFAIPTGVHPLKFNAYGNLNGATYTQLLSRLRGFGEQGYSANATGSSRSRSKRKKADYFVGEPGGLPRGIYARVGPNKRGFHTVFYLTRQPRYQPQFPVSSILQSKFSERFPSIFERLVFSAR